MWWLLYIKKDISECTLTPRPPALLGTPGPCTLATLDTAQTQAMSPPTVPSQTHFLLFPSTEWVILICTCVCFIENLISYIKGSSPNSCILKWLPVNQSRKEKTHIKIILFLTEFIHLFCLNHENFNRKKQIFFLFFY